MLADGTVVVERLDDAHPEGVGDDDLARKFAILVSLYGAVGRQIWTGRTTGLIASNVGIPLGLSQVSGEATACQLHQFFYDECV